MAKTQRGAAAGTAAGVIVSDSPRDTGRDTGGDSEDVIEPDDDLARLEVEEALEDMPSEARASLHWLDPKSNEWVYICQLTADQVRREFVRENFGGGKFKGRFRVGQRWGRTFQFSIDPALPRRVPAWLLGPGEATPAKGNPDLGSAAPVVRRAGPTDDDGINMALLLKSEFMDLIRTGRESRAAQAESTTALMTTVMTMVKNMAESTTAMIRTIGDNRRGDDSLKLADVVNLLEKRQPNIDAIVAALEKARGGARSAGDLESIEQVLSLVDRIRGKRRRPSDDDDDGDGGGEDGDPFATVARELVPPLVKLLTGENVPPIGGARAPTVRAEVQPSPAGAAAPAPAQPAAPSGAVPAPSPVPTAPPTFLDTIYTSVLEAAQEGQDPQEFAVSILQITPRIFRGHVREFVMQADATPIILHHYPTLQPYGRWVEECVATLRAEFMPPAEPGGEAGNAGEPAGGNAQDK